MAKTEQTAPKTEPMPATSPAIDAADGVDARAVALIQQIHEEKRAAQAGADVDASEAETEAPPENDNDDAETPVNDNDAPAPAAAASTPAVDERKEALKRAAELERNAQRATARLAEREARAEARERDLEAKAAEVERVLAALKDPASALELVGKHIPPEQLADWMVQSQKPEVRAEWAAKKAAREAHPEIAEMRQELQALRQERAQERLAVARQREEQAVIGAAKQLAEAAPYASALAERKPERFLQRVHAAADALRQRGETLSYERIVEAIEADLADDAPVFAPKPAASDTQSSEPATQAAASKARTLSARTTAGRSTVASGDDVIAPLEERALAIKNKIARGVAF